MHLSMVPLYAYKPIWLYVISWLRSEIIYRVNIGQYKYTESQSLEPAIQSMSMKMPNLRYTEMDVNTMP